MAKKCDVIEISESENESSELDHDDVAGMEISSPISSDDNEEECDYEDSDEDDDSDYVYGDDEGDYDDEGSKDRDSDDGNEFNLIVSENQQEHDIVVDINDEESVCNKVIQFIQGKCSFKSLKVVECKVFLRKYGLKISGTKAECIERIKEFWKSQKRTDINNECDIHVYVNDGESAYNKVIQFIQGKCSLKSVKLHECKVFLRRHGLRVLGTKEECGERVKDFWRLKDGDGGAFYPRSSFTINCTGDVCKGDVVIFSQKVHSTSDKIKRDGNDVGTRTVAGRIVKESYGATKQQHTFTVEVFWSKGTKKLAPLFPLLVKGRKLYKFKTFRQSWKNEQERSDVLAEKHQRGALARAVRAMRKLHIAKRTDKPKISRGVLGWPPVPSLATHVIEIPSRQVSVPMNVAYAAQAKDHIKCYHCKEVGHVSRNCDKKSCNYCKNSGHFINECPTRPENRNIRAFHNVGTSANAPTGNHHSSQQQSNYPIAGKCEEKYCNYCKKNGHLIKECPTRPENRFIQAFQKSSTSAPAPHHKILTYGQQSYNQVAPNQKFCNHCKMDGHLISECHTRPENRCGQSFQNVGVYANAVSQVANEKFCNYCKKTGHLIQECPTRPENRHGRIFHGDSYACAPSEPSPRNYHTYQQRSYPSSTGNGFYQER